MKAILLEIMYILTGLVAVSGAIAALKDKEHPHPKATAAFWGLFGALFIFGKYIPGYVVGICILVIGVIAAMNKVTNGSMQTAKESERKIDAERLGNKIFIPAIAIGVTAFLIAQYVKSLGSLVGLGIGAFISLVIGMLMTKSKTENIHHEGARLLLGVGASAILPQLLTALGALFNKAGVGQLISEMIGGIIPDGHILAGVTAYCIGMALFTMIMGNAFAAFAVITTGVGLPFVYAHGANPAIAGALALTAGYCGTLLTPMAANFNIVPAALLNTKNENRVIIAQAPFSIALLVTHIFLMYILAF